MSDETLLALMRRDGADLATVEGRTVAMHFGDAAGEYRALRESAGVVDLPWLERLRVTGSDRVTFLQGMVSNDVATLAPGAGCQALLLNEQGKALAELIVLAGDEALVLDGVASSLTAARPALERFIVADDVELTAPSEPQRAFAVLGPEASAVLERLDLTVPSAPYAHTPAAIPETAPHVVRVPSPGVGGFVVHVPLVAAAAWWQRCRDDGRAVVAGTAAFDVLRIESGVPWHGRDVTAETLALEAPYEAAISFRKGCYLGQEVMERVTARGHVNRKLVGVEITADVAPPAGARLFAADREVGWVTSARRSWRLDRVVGLAYVRREYLAPGSLLALGAADGVPVTVRALPF